MPKGKYIQEADTGRLAGSEPYPFSKPETLSQETVDAVAAYAGDSYAQVNAALRDDEEIPLEEAEQLVTLLDEAIVSQHAMQNITVVRAIDESFASKLKSGQTIVDHAYLSTSMDIEGMETAIEFTMSSNQPHYADSREYAILEIDVPKGTPLLDVGRDRLRAANTQRFSSAEEKEVLFGRGTRLKITGIQRKGRNGLTTIQAKLSYGDRREPKFSDGNDGFT